jgi:hypothetical protein
MPGRFPPPIIRDPWGWMERTASCVAVPSAPRPGVASGVRGNLGELGGGRQPAPPVCCLRRSLRASFSCSKNACPKLDKEKLPIAGEFRELFDHLGEDLERAIEMAPLVSCHQAGPKEGSGRRDGRVEGDVGVDAGIE